MSLWEFLDRRFEAWEAMDPGDRFFLLLFIGLPILSGIGGLLYHLIDVLGGK